MSNYPEKLYETPEPEEHQGPDIAVALIVGLVAAVALGEHLKRPYTWAVIVGVAFLGFFATYWIRNRLLAAKPLRDLEPNEAAQLADSILKSQHASYALSTNWIDLWRTDAFRYYLSLDQVSSLAIYTRMQHSPLAGFTSSHAVLDTFIDDCKKLMQSVGAGVPPVAQHRMRVLIYPRAVYEKHGNRVIQLLRMHAAGRVVCIPLVSEELEDALTHAERQLMRSLAVSQLHQTVRDKIPPQPSVRRNALRHAVVAEEGVIFPDMLLIDPSKETRTLWWYNDTSVRHVDGDDLAINNAYQAFRVVCLRGRNAIWTNFSANQIGRLPVVLNEKSSSAELFFALDYYENWIAWIRGSASTDPAAGSLNRWLDAESMALRQFAEQAAHKLGGGGTPCPLKVIDVGCGYGRHLMDLALHIPNLKGLGVDVIPSMVAKASHDSRVQHLDDRLYFCSDDATELSAAGAEEFDAAICMTNTLGNLESDKVASALSQMRRVLKPTGTLVVSVYSPNSDDDRMRSYERVRLHVARIDKKIVAAEGLESSHFEKGKIQDIISDAGYVVRHVSDLEGVGWFVIAQRG